MLQIENRYNKQQYSQSRKNAANICWKKKQLQLEKKVGKMEKLREKNERMFFQVVQKLGMNISQN